MKSRKRLTRQESKQATRIRLIEAGEALFIRKGFNETSVDEISAMAGYSRGAFYSNFDDKGQLFLAVIDRRRPKALDTLDAIFQRLSKPTERIAAVREWFSKQWQCWNFIALQLEFSRRAMRDRNVRKHLTELWQQEIEILATSVCRHCSTPDGVPPERPEIIGLVLLAIVHGLGTLALDTGPEMDFMYREAARLAFDRLIVPQDFHPGMAADRRTALQVSQTGEL